jgi:hypothetical protein
MPWYIRDRTWSAYNEASIETGSTEKVELRPNAQKFSRQGIKS